MIFEIPLANGQSVFMKGENSDYYSVVHVDSEKFWSFWDKEKLHRSKEDWYQRKYQSASKCFAQSAEYPVPLANVGSPFDYSPNIITFKMNDGITRLQWLFDNGAKSFPVYVSPSESEWFMSNVGA